MMDEIQIKVKSIFENMGIKKAIIIDDKVYNADFDPKTFLEILDGYRDSEDFDIIQQLKELGYDDINSVKDSASEEKIDKKIIDFLKEKFPKDFKSELDILFSKLIEIFGKDNIFKYASTSVVEKNAFTSDTVLFLDYQLEEVEPYSSEKLANILSKKDTSSFSPRCIIFMSNTPNFTFDGQTFYMLSSIDKYKYFKSLRTKQVELNYKNSLYDFIPKSELESEESLLNSLHNILNNLYSGQVFYKLLFQINKVLEVSCFC